MMQAVTHLSPIIGVDIHIVQPPAAPPMPIPHPYIGLVFDPFDYVPIFGSTIFIHGLPRAIAGTAGMPIPSHIPIGGTFLKPPGNQDENFMGSATVAFDGDAATYTALPVISCQDIGMIAPIRPNPKKKSKMRTLVLPTSVVLAIPAGPPVLIGGPPTISLMALGMRAGMVGLGKGLKRLARSNLVRRGMDAFKKARQRVFRNMNPSFLKCNVFKAEPVDVVTGEVVLDQQDYSIPGRIPLEWTRHYSSRSERMGVCGYGWETPADARLEFEDDGAVTFHDGAGVPTYFPSLPTRDQPVMEPVDGGTLHRIQDFWAVRLKNGLIYYFPVATDAKGEVLVQHIMDLCENALTFVRGAEGLKEIVESAGRRIAVDSQEGLIRRMRLRHPDDPDPHPLLRFEYAADGDLLAVYDALENPYRFAYREHRLIQHTNRVGLSFYYEYDEYSPDGRCLHSWGDGGLYDYHFTYKDLEGWTEFTDSLGHPWAVSYDHRYLITEERDPLGGKTLYEYDAVGRTTAVIDPDGHRTEYEYDERGNLKKLTRPDGHTIASTFDALNKATSITDPNGAVWRQEWNKRGLLTRQISPLGAVSRYKYDGYGQLAVFTNPRDARTELEFDALGNLVKLTDALGHRTRFGYDILGNVTEKIDPLDHRMAYRYDAKGRLSGVRLPSGAKIGCAYDAEDNLVRYVNENGAETGLEYFGLGEIKRRLQPDGYSVEYHYDAEERLIGVTNQRGELYQLKRDPLGRIVEEVDYWGQGRRYIYNAAGGLCQSIDPLGRVIKYRTDPLGRIRKKILPHPEQPDATFEETFEFDANGNLVSATNPHVTIILRFDDEGRLVEEAQGAFVIRNSYDQSGNRVRRETSGGNTVVYEYDALDRTEGVRINDEPPIRIERDACGQIIRELLGEYLARHYRYGHDGLIASQSIRRSERWLLTTEFAYDPAGNLTQRKEGEYGTDKYLYDHMDHLREHVDPQGRISRFLIDPAGDRLITQIIQGAGQSASGVQARVVEAWSRKGHYQGADYSFDQAGNLVWRGDKQRVTRFLWNANQCLVRIDTNGVSIRYAYDPLGRRIFKDNNSGRTRFGWDGDALVAEGGVEPDSKMTDGHRMQRQEYIYYPGTFTPLALVVMGSNDKEIFYFQNDPNGCPTRLVNKEGETVWLARHGTFGELDRFLGELVSNPIRLQGQYEDQETGLSYNRYRYFDSNIAQYISQDPIRLAASDNMYKLAPNCFKYADPLGLKNSKFVEEEGETIIEIINPYVDGTKESTQLNEFVEVWNDCITNSGGQMTTRQEPLTPRQSSYHESWRRTIRRANRKQYPSSFIVVGHVPDTAMGGPIAHNRWGNTVGETMPLYATVNNYLSTVTSQRHRGRTYHKVRLVSCTQ